MPDVFYVYVLFDHLGTPRYIGKGKGRRWLAHEQQRKTNHRLKNHFLSTTIGAIGCIPKVKIRECLSEPEAFEIEAAFIKAIGRYPAGPLVNLTDKRNGPTSQRIKDWHASRTPEERSASMKKTQNNTPAPVKSAKGRRNALAAGSEVLSQRMKSMRERETIEQRRERGRMAGLASAKAKTPDEHRASMAKASAAYMAKTTPEERREVAKRTGIGMATKEQLSEWSRRGHLKRKQLAFNNLPAIIN